MAHLFLVALRRQASEHWVIIGNIWWSKSPYVFFGNGAVNYDRTAFDESILYEDRYVTKTPMSQTQ